MKINIRQLKKIIILSIFTWISVDLSAQTMTEIYIPLGKSPGVSGKYSLIGRVESFNMIDSSMTIMLNTGSRKNMIITSVCDIYLDKSKLRLRNKKGYCADIKKGLLVEAKYFDNKPDRPIEWLKIQIE
jgi:hypothetical protein